MKIAIATMGEYVSGHFGTCENFTIVEVENSDVRSRAVIDTSGNQHGLLPAFLASQKVNVVIAGGMGDGARQNLKSKGIDIVSGVSGKIDDTIREYLNGSLKSADAGCSGHGHAHGHDHGTGGCSCGSH